MAERSHEPVSTRWIDALKAVAILWIFLNHAVERVLGSPYIANPAANWPPLQDRVAQLAPVDYGSTLADLTLNALRYVGWAGDQGVQLFLIASGFGLTWSLLSRGGAGRWRDFFRRRLGRIYPLWWGAHLAFAIPSFLLGLGLQLGDPRFYLSLLGFRATPETMYYFAPAWWFIGLILQLYLVFPLLFGLLRRLGVGRFLMLTLSTSLVIRLAGLYAFHAYLDAWSRGAVFITRLPEFVLGMALAWWWRTRSTAVDRGLRSGRILLLATACYAVANLLALTLWGMALAPFLQGTAAMVALYPALHLLTRRSGAVHSPVKWLSDHAYSLYLVHQPLLMFAMKDTGRPSLARMALAVPVLAVSVLVAIVLERAVDVTRRVLASLWRHRRSRRAAASAAVLVVALYGLLIGAEVLVRAVDPQEVYGWGERPSLEPDPQLGWRLIPSTTTRLRWESYDYVVKANALGFPAPLYPDRAPPGTYRIMTLGDAFTSAEGVDTDQAWPRLLERDLRARVPSEKVQVLNFAITGYGPNQYVAVLQKYGPRFRPDLIVVGFFVNDFEDVLASNAEFARSIGFGRPSEDSLHSYLMLAQLTAWLRLTVGQSLRDRLLGRPCPQGYFLGDFRSLERSPDGPTQRGRALVRERLADLVSLARSIHATVVLALVPAPVQVCGPGDLRYYPRGVDLGDTGKFDVDQPQRVTERIAAELGLATYDLRAPLRRLDSCPYQPRNMHWLPAGHEAVASYLCHALIRDGFIRPATSAEER